jgi:excisionase family DNA binding protein
MSEHEPRATVDVATAAEILGVNKLTLYDAIRRGDSPVPVIKVGRRYLISKSELDRVLGVEAP